MTRHSKVFVPVSLVDADNLDAIIKVYKVHKQGGYYPYGFAEEKENVYVLTEQEYDAIEQENKELKEEVERLTKICNGCFEKIHNKSVEIEKLKAVKQNESNY